MRNAIIVIWVLVFVGSRDCLAQPLSKQQHWQLLDHQEDSVYGTSVNRAYKELLKGKTSHPVIVAVIDEGVDISHEDLQGHIWTNQKEIPGNGIDDDKDGYVDDVHGWNFLGGKDGRNIYATNSEADREYARLLPQAATMDAAQRKYFETVKKEHIDDSVGRNRDLYSLLDGRLRWLAMQDSIMKAVVGVKVLNYPDVVSFQPKDSVLIATKKALLNFYAQNSPHNKEISLDSVIRLGRAYM